MSHLSCPSCGYVIAKMTGVPDVAKAPAGRVDRAVNDFLNERLRTLEGGSVASREVYADYVAWCAQRAAQPVSHKALTMSLGRLGVVATRTRKERRYGDVVLR